jgi:hypothetical protein
MVTGGVYAIRSTTLPEVHRGRSSLTWGQAACRRGCGRCMWLGGVLALIRSERGLSGWVVPNRKAPELGTRPSLCISSQSQMDDLGDEGFVADASPLGGLGHLFAISDVGIGIGFENDQLIVGGQSQVHAAVILKL